MSDTYNNQEELVRASIWALSQGQTPSQIHKSIRDQSMNLTTTSVAFRGDNLHHLLWSDIFCRDIAMPELGPDFKALVSSVSSALVCDVNSTTITSGCCFFELSGQNQHGGPNR